MEEEVIVKEERASDDFYAAVMAQQLLVPQLKAEDAEDGDFWNCPLLLDDTMTELRQMARLAPQCPLVERRPWHVICVSRLSHAACARRQQLARRRVATQIPRVRWRGCGGHHGDP